MTNGAELASLRLIRVSDDFIAFMYAAGVSVFLEKAHDGELFNDLGLTLCVTVSIFFFAQDWLSRFGGFRRIEGIKATTFYMKAVLDVAVVVCLCLIILDIISQMTKGVVAFGPAEATLLYYKIAVFAGISWAWNMVLIFTVVIRDPTITGKDILSFLFTGRVSDKILTLFPRVWAQLKEMEGWAEKCIKEVHDSSKQLQTDRKLGKHVRRETWLLVCHYALNPLFVGPCRLILFTFTCWVGLHLIVLNLFLGVLLGISPFEFRGQLVGRIVLENWPLSTFLTVLILLFLFWMSAVFRTKYFSGGTRRYEILGWVGFWFFLLITYSILFSKHVLPLVVAAQQIAANVFILKFLAPTGTTQPSKGSRVFESLEGER